MKKFFILITCMLAMATNLLNAQIPAIEWQKGFGSSASEDAIRQVKTGDGGYIALGYTDATEPFDGDLTGLHGHGGTDVWVFKFDIDGNLVWSKMYGGSGHDNATAIDITPNGVCVIAGTTYSNDGDFSGNHGMSDIFVLRLDAADGHFLSNKLLGGSLAERAASVKHVPGGGFIIGGTTTSSTNITPDGDVSGNHAFDGGTPNLWSDCWVVKLNVNGLDIDWAKCYGGFDSDEATSISVTDDGGFIMAAYVSGFEASSGDITNFHASPGVITQDAWAVKLNSTGDIDWQKCYGGGFHDYSVNIEQTNDGGYIFWEDLIQLTEI